MKNNNNQKKRKYDNLNPGPKRSHSALQVSYLCLVVVDCRLSAVGFWLLGCPGVVRGCRAVGALGCRAVQRLSGLLVGGCWVLAGDRWSAVGLSVVGDTVRMRVNVHNTQCF